MNNATNRSDSPVYRWRAGTPVTTINDAVLMYLAHCQTQRRSPNTMRAYANDANVIIQTIAANTGADPDNLPISLFERNTLNDAFADYAASHAESSHRRCWAVWNGIGRHLTTYEHIAKNPMDQVPSASGSREVTIPKALPVNAVDQLLNTLANPEPEHATDAHRQWWQRDYAMVLLLLTIGVRVDELCRITIGNVAALGDDTGARIVTVQGKGRKQRALPIEAPVVDVLEEYLVSRALRHPQNAKRGKNIWSRWEPNAPLFVAVDDTPIRPSTVYSRLSLAYRRAGITAHKAPGAMVHQLRHTFATMTADDPQVTVFQLQWLLGHSSLSSTERYTRGAGKEVRNASRRNPIYKMLE